MRCVRACLHNASSQGEKLGGGGVRRGRNVGLSGCRFGCLSVFARSCCLGAVALAIRMVRAPSEVAETPVDECPPRQAPAAVSVLRATSVSPRSHLLHAVLPGLGSSPWQLAKLTPLLH